MKPEVVLTAEAEHMAREHLLGHYIDGWEQEELCFGYWRQSTGARAKDGYCIRHHETEIWRTEPTRKRQFCITLSQ